MLSEAERRQIIEGWNETAAAYPRELSLSELFEAQVDRMPAATALVYGAQQFSYGELNERANRLAHYLLQLGVQAEARVGILLERTLALIVSLLGVLKAGGCYVPLDPQYPQERLEFMRADAGLACAVDYPGAGDGEPVGGKRRTTVGLCGGSGAGREQREP